MLNPKFFFESLTQNGIEFFTGVPDSLLKYLCAYITENTKKKQHIIAANEGGAFSLGVGYHLATNKIPLIYMQNSGLGNIINPLLSIADADVYSIPVLLLIGWRGEPNVKDEPQHKKQGRITTQLLETMNIAYRVLDPNENNMNGLIKDSIDYVREKNAPFAMVVKKNTFEKYSLQKEDTIKEFPLSREDAIRLIINQLDKTDIVISTTGMASRELYEFREERNEGHENDFLIIGGMGHASQIALGVALHKLDKRIYCLDGDGSVLMHMGSLAICGNMNCSNYKHIVFNNGAHDSVGGQPTVALDIDLQVIAKSVGYQQILSASTESEIKAKINELKNFDGSSFMEVFIRKGFRKNLGRPTMSPIENKKAFMRYLNNE